MKTEKVKSMGHEAGYLILLLVSIIIVMALVFPLWLALVPVAVLAGYRAAWRLDHMKNNKHLTN